MPKKSLAQQTTEHLYNMIAVEHQLSPGDKLPNEIELAQALGVSRTTLREAIHSLVSQGLLEVRRGRGTFVPHQTGVIHDPLGFAYMPDQARLSRELLDIRLNLEPWMAAMAAQHATEEDIASMRAKLSEMDELIAAKDYESLSPVTRAFHRQMTNLCGQNRILRVIEGQDEFITRFSAMAIRQEDQLLDAHKEHYALVDYIEKRDLAGFQDLTERHINRSKEMCLAALAEQRKHQNF